MSAVENFLSRVSPARRRSRFFPCRAAVPAAFLGGRSFSSAITSSSRPPSFRAPHPREVVRLSLATSHSSLSCPSPSETLHQNCATRIAHFFPIVSLWTHLRAAH